MNIIKLIPKSKHGKDRVKKHGDQWKIVENFPHSFLLESLNPTFLLKGKMIPDTRRISKTDDPNFDWELL